MPSEKGVGCIGGDDSECAVLWLLYKFFEILDADELDLFFEYDRANLSCGDEMNSTRRRIILMD